MTPGHVLRATGAAAEPGVRRRRFLQVSAGLGLATCGARLQAQAPAGTGVLRLGIVPYLSPTVLLQAYRPLREHLEAALGRPVEATTARDFTRFVQATREGRFDVALLPAHVARLAMLDWGFAPVAVTLASVTVQVLTREGGAVRTPADLRGRMAGMLDPLSLTATAGRKWLQDQGLAGSVRIVPQPSINSALFALDRDEVSIVVAAPTQLLALPDSTPQRLRVLATVADIPGPIYVARPGLSMDELARLRAAMQSFVPDTTQPGGAQNTRLSAPDAELLDSLDDYAAIARRALAAPR